MGCFVAALLIHHPSIMPKTPTSTSTRVTTARVALSSTASGSRSTRCPRPRPRNPPPASVTTPTPTAPSWLRTDWSETSFPPPVFHGSFYAGSQMEWAAKNATVAIHDAFQYGAWGVIVDKTYAVYLAVCDLVLQRYVTATSVL